MQLSSIHAGFLAWLAGRFGHVAKLAILEALEDYILSMSDGPSFFVAKIRPVEHGHRQCLVTFAVL